MHGQGLKGVRAAQMLALLREHGPLSVGTLGQLLQPAIDPRRAREVIQRMAKKGLVFPVRHARGLNGGIVYEISRSNETRVKIAALLKMPSTEGLYAFTRGREVLHGEICAVWSEFFRREFPGARVVRDWEIGKDSRISRMILNTELNRDLLPDFVVNFPRSDGHEPVLVGVEVERSRKKFARLQSKMRALVMQTQLDAVLYLCDDSGLADTLRRAMIESGMHRSRRVGRYLRSFLVFASFSQVPQSTALPVATLGFDVLALGDWLHRLRAKPAHLRDESWFKVPATSGWQNEEAPGASASQIGEAKRTFGGGRPPHIAPLKLPDPTPST